MIFKKKYLKTKSDFMAYLTLYLTLMLQNTKKNCEHHSFIGKTCNSKDNIYF